MPNKDQYAKVFIGGSAIEGRGLFAKQAIRKDENIFRLDGPVIRFPYQHDYRRGPHWINIGKNRWVMPVPDAPFRYLNHSCQPNIGWGKNRYLVAMRPIRPKEEITIDYSCTESLPNWRLKCSCGTPACRRVIRSVQFLPHHLFEKYKKYIPEFLQHEYLRQKFYIPRLVAGAGVFSKQALKRGDAIFTVDGPIVHYPFQPDFRTGPFWLGVGERSWIVPNKDNPWRFMNHSCQPNTGLIRKNSVVALKDIRADEEITIDDSITEAAPQWRRTCHCGTPRCRREIRSIQFLPPEKYTQYMPFIPPFMQKVYNKKIHIS